MLMYLKFDDEIFEPFDGHKILSSLHLLALGFWVAI
jgi:hypothetical protein